LPEALRRGKPIVMMHRAAALKRRRRARTPALWPAIMASCARWSNAPASSSSTRHDELVDVSEIPPASRSRRRRLGILTFSGAFCGIAHDFAGTSAFGCRRRPTRSPSDADAARILAAEDPLI
jgi:hypothetical protein